MTVFWLDGRASHENHMSDCCQADVEQVDVGTKYTLTLACKNCKKECRATIITKIDENCKLGDS